MKPYPIQDNASFEALLGTYQSFWRDEPQVYTSHPYCLKLFKQRWYMLAKTEGKKEPRTYALDERMINVTVLDKPLRRPAGFKADEKNTVFRYHLVPTFDFKQELLGRGASVEVLSPDWFRNEVAADVAEMAKL